VEGLRPGTHRFRLRQTDTDGTSTRSAPVTLAVPVTEALRLSPPTPNPARTTTRFRFGVRAASEATVELYNVLGQWVATLYEGTPAAGQTQTVHLRGETLGRLPSGPYFLRLEAGGRSRTRCLTIAR
jgi:hypothetical protein